MPIALLEKLGLSKERKDATRWRAPVALDQGAIGGACYAMDRHGRGQAVWENGGSLWTQTLGPGSEASFGRLPLGEGRDPHITANLEGRGVAAWVFEGPTERAIIGLPFDPAQGQASSRTLFKTFGQIRGIQIAVDRRGGAMVVWSHELDGEWETLAKRFDVRAKTWDEEPTRLGPRVRHPIEPVLAMNRRGQAIVVWEEKTEHADGLVAAFYLPSEKQWSDRPVAIAPGNIRDYQAALDHAGNIVILWVNHDYGHRPALEARLYAAERGDWLEPEVLATAHSFQQVRLAMTGSGEALAVWQQSEGTTQAFLHSKAYRAGAWEDRVTRLDTEGGRVEAFTMALGPKGAASLLCLAHGQDGHIPLLRDRAKAWGAPVPLGKRGSARLSEPLLCLCPQGAAALWRMEDGRDTRLVYAQKS